MTRRPVLALWIRPRLWPARRGGFPTAVRVESPENLFGGLSAATPVSTRSLRSQRCDLVGLGFSFIHQTASEPTMRRRPRHFARWGGAPLRRALCDAAVRTGGPVRAVSCGDCPGPRHNRPGRGRSYGFAVHEGPSSTSRTPRSRGSVGKSLGLHLQTVPHGGDPWG